MAHRTQVILSDAQYAGLLEISQDTGIGLGELIRRAIDGHYRTAGRAELRTALDASFGSWDSAGVDGATYVDGMRRGMARRLSRP